MNIFKTKKTKILLLTLLTIFNFSFYMTGIVEAATPNLTSFTSTTANGSYGIGDEIKICANFDTNLKNPSTMKITLDTGVQVDLKGPAVGSVGGTMSADTSQFTNHASFVQGHLKGALKLPDGKYLIWGSTTDIDGNTDADYIARLNSDGSFDPTFAQLNLNNSIYSLGIQSDGKIIIGGAFTQFNGVNEGYVRLARLNSDGTLDKTFEKHTVKANVEVVTIQSDDKILIGGNFRDFDGQSNLDRIARLNSDGSLDTDFNPLSFNNATHAMTVQSDGKILVGGAFHTYNGNAAYDRLVRLNSDGSLDTDFSNNFPADTSKDITEIEVQSDGKIIIAGDIVDFDGQSNLDNIAKLNSDGSRDTTFSGTISSAVNAIYVENNGKILVSEISSPHMSRLNSDGTVDSNFTMPDELVGNKQIYDFFPDGEKIFIAGNFNDLGGNADQDKFGQITGDSNTAGADNNQQICGEYIVSAGENTGDLTVTSIDSENVQDENGDTQAADIIPSGNNLADNSDIEINTSVDAPNMTDGTDSGSSNTDNKTKNAKPNFEVQCVEANDIIKLYSDKPNPGTEIGTHTCVGAGVELVSPTNDLSEGIHNISYTLTNSNGDESPHSKTLEITIDTTNPNASSITSPSDNSVTNETKPTFEGSGEAGAELVVKDENGDTICSVIIPSGGKWSCVAESQISEGNHSFSTETTDLVGNGAVVGGSINLSIDTTSPEKPTSLPDMTDTTDSGSDNQDNLTNIISPEFNLICQGDNKVILYIDGVETGNGTCSNGSVNIIPNIPLSEGEHKISYTETDAAVNESEKSPELTINIDTTLPVAPTNVSTSPNPAKNGASVTTTVSGVAAGDKVSIPGMTCSPDPSDGSDVQCTGTVGQNGLDGVDTVITITDPAGNVDVSKDSGLLVDNLAPVIDSLSVDLSGDNPIINFTGSDDIAVDHYEIQYDGSGDFVEVSSPVTTSFNKTDTHSVIVKVIDTSGNESTEIIEWPVLININAPTKISNASITDTSFTITSASGNDITIDSIEGGSGFNCVGDNNDTESPYTQTVTCSGGTISETGDLIVTASDGSASGKAEHHYVIDTTASTITIIPNVKKDNQSITDTEIIINDDNGIDVSNVSVDPSTDIQYSNFSCTQLTKLKVSCSISIDNGSEENQNLIIKAVDDAGNEITKSQNGYKVDSIAPAVPIIDQPIDGLVTVNKKPTITGTAEPNSTVTIFINGQAVGDVAVDENGNYSFELPEPGLKEGNNTITAQAVDSLGNTSPMSTTTTVEVDLTKPDKPSSIPNMTDETDTGISNTDNNTANSKPSFEIFCSSDEDTVTLYVDGVANGVGICENGKAIITPEDEISNGSHQISYTETDTAGNESEASDNLDIVINAIELIKSEITSPANNSVIKNKKPTFEGNGAVGAKVKVKDEIGNILCEATVGGDGKWSCLSNIELPEGNHQFKTITDDESGNGPVVGDLVSVQIYIPKGHSGKRRSSVKITKKVDLEIKKKKEVVKKEVQNNETENNFLKETCPINLWLKDNLKKGDKDNKHSLYNNGRINQVKLLQKHMNRLGFRSGPEDGIFGRQTYAAVKRMQKFLGTSVDGIVGPKTRYLINHSCSSLLNKETDKKIKIDTKKCPIFTKYYRSGDKGGEIPQIQQFLKNQGFNPGSIDGIMGPRTISAIKSFQLKYADEILKHWGLKKATGRWYQTTRAKANHLVGCKVEIKMDNGKTVKY